ncbi:MAG: replicative DNA helicase [Kiritimatiellae bacterium]|nr:replicative DNA helicase [Kiritimatiellia bacterium]
MAAAKTKRIPPSSTEAERAVLGSILLDTTGVGEDRVLDIALAGGITSESFYDPRNVKIFAAIEKLSRNSRPLDPLTLIDELKVSGELDGVGGEAYVTGLIDDTPTTAHAEYYIKIVREKALRRTMIAKSEQVVKRCYDEADNPDPQAVLGFAEKSFLEIGTHSNKTQSWASAVAQAGMEIDNLFDSGGRIVNGLSTGLTHLDERLMGLKKAEMIVIAARPSVGKTSLAMNIAESVATGCMMNGMPVKHDPKPHPVGIFSLEMPVLALVKRMVAGAAQINTWQLNRNLMPKDVRKEASKRLGPIVDRLKKAPLVVDDSAGLDVMDLRARARRMKKQHGIELIVIDYLQLCQCRDMAKQGRQQEVSMISQQIKAMAKELNVPVIVLSQLSRDNEKRGDKYEKPKLSDLRDSGAIEQDADVVLLLRRPSRVATDPDSKDERLAIIDVAKNRNGETGEVKVEFWREYTRFFDRDLGAEGKENVVSEDEIDSSMEQGELYSEDPNL